MMAKSMGARRERLRELHAHWPERYPALLESAARSGKLGRYDILLCSPNNARIDRADVFLLTKQSDADFLSQLAGVGRAGGALRDKGVGRRAFH
jgi:hypothetical protein